MRLLKVRIRRGDHLKGEPQMVYPKVYDAVEVDRLGKYSTGLNIADVSMSGEIGKGGEEQFCIIALPDNIAERYAEDPDIAIITSEEADNLMESWRIANNIPTDFVRDKNRIDAIRAKQEVGITISDDDINALDPNHPELGINRTRQPVANVLDNINDELGSLSEKLKSHQKVDASEII